MASDTNPVVINFPTAAAVLGNWYGCVLWHQAIETTGAAAAEYQLWDGTNTQGALMMDVALSSGQSTRDYIHKHHLMFRNGLYYVPVSGSIRGSISVLAGCRCVHHDFTVEYQPNIVQVITP